MESYRHEHRMNPGVRQRQAGVTAIGFVFLAALFGVIALGVLKVVPLYLQNMRLTTVLESVQVELDGNGGSALGIKNALYSRFSIEGLTIPEESVKITQVREGYQVRIQYENRTEYVADLWFLLEFDKQIEIRR